MTRSLIAYVVILAVAVGCVGFASLPVAAEPLSIDTLGRPAQGDQQQITEIRDAMERFQNRDIAGALAMLQSAVKKHPELPPPQIIMAQFSIAANQPAMVLSWLRKAVREAPNDPEAFVMLGQHALSNRRTIEAELLFLNANKLLGQFEGDAKRKETLQTDVYARLANLAGSRKDWKTAQSHVDALLKIQPDNAGAIRLLGRSLFEQKQPAEALAQLKKAAVIDKDSLTPEAILAQWYEAAGSRANATKYMIAALTAKPKDFKTRLAAAEWALQAHEFDQARQQADLAIQLDPDSQGAKQLAGSIAIFQKDYAAAEKYLKAVLDRSPASFAVSNNLALALCEQDDPVKKQLALDYARINSRLYPKDVEPASTHGRVLFRLGKLAEAEQAFRHATSLSRNLTPDTAYYIACVYAERDRKEEAKRLLRSALKSEGLFSQRQDAEALLQRLSR